MVVTHSEEDEVIAEKTLAKILSPSEKATENAPGKRPASSPVGTVASGVPLLIQSRPSLLKKMERPAEPYSVAVVSVSFNVPSAVPSLRHSDRGSPPLLMVPIPSQALK